MAVSYTHLDVYKRQVRKHAPLSSFDPMISETLVEVMNAEGPQLHTNAIPKAVVKNADGSLTLELEDGRSETAVSYTHLAFTRIWVTKAKTSRCR